MQRSRRVVLILALMLTAAACRPWYAARTASANMDTSEAAVSDRQVLDIVAPYRAAMDSSMDIVVAELGEDLVKEQPESNLGNHVAEAVLDAARASSERRVDLAIVNYGGLRVPSVNKGPLLIADAYQIMPFDNFIVIIEMSGAVLKELADQIAGYGGWPVHGMSFVIDRGRALDIAVGGRPVVPDSSYTVALSDFLADGGDDLDILKQFTYQNTGVFLRDAIIDAWKSAAAEGREVIAGKDGRVTVRNSGE